MKGPTKMCEPGTDPTLERKFRGHKDAITALCFSPNDDQLVSSSLDSSLMLWKLRGTMRSYRFDGHREAVLDVTFSPTGKLLASVSRDRSVRLWLPTVTGSTGEIRSAHSQTVRSVQFTSDGLKLVTSSDDKTIKLWSVARQKFISSFCGHTNWVLCARLSNDNSIIASCSDDKTLKLWDIDSGQTIHTFTEQKGSGQHVAWHPSGCYVAVALTNGTVKLYDTRTHSLLQHYRIHDGAVSQISFHPSGSYLLTCSKDNKMKVLDLLEGHPVYTLTGHSSAVSAVAFSPNGDYFASAGEDKQVLIWKTNFAELSDDSVKENTEKITQGTCSKTDESKLNISQEANLRNRCFLSKKAPIDCYFVKTYRDESIRYNKSVTPSPPVHRSFQTDSVGPPGEDRFYHVSDISHIPRLPPSPSHYTLPKVVPSDSDESLIGMISLKRNDVCYTTGIIEWVGKKRSFKDKGPLTPSPEPEPIVKKRKRGSNNDNTNNDIDLLHEPLVQRHSRTSQNRAVNETCSDKSTGHNYFQNSDVPLLQNHRLLQSNLSKNICSDRDVRCNEHSVERILQTHTSSGKITKTYRDKGVGTGCCDCSDVIPTINIIVDHVNALNDALEVLDERLNIMEDNF